MKKFLPVILLFCFFISDSVFAQNVFNASDPIRSYPSPAPATPPANTLAKWYRTARQSWNTDKFKCYYWNGMVFRLRFPNGYNPADVTTKYPMIVFFHGGGEIGPISDNDYQLQWGAQPFEQKMNQGQFNSFMLFPQATQSSGWNSTHYDRVNSILDSLQKYCNMDPDRVISMGLSNGGYGALGHAAYNPLRDATVIASSPALISNFTNADRTNLLYSPVWLSSGGKDVNPSPQDVTNFVNDISSKGGDIRYTFFPDLGHLTWSEQWAEPYLVPYWTTAHKANPLIFFQKNNFPNEASVNAKLGISAGFAQYQWQKNSVDIASATSNEYTATSSGSYRVRFRRTAGGAWSDWSPNPAVITIDVAPPAAPASMTLRFTGSNFVNLSWRKSLDNGGVSGYDVYVDGAKKYTTVDTFFTAESLLPNTSYSFTVKAFDEAGNSSSASNAVTTKTLNYANGLKYKYYEGTYTTLPNFTTSTPVRTGVTPGVDITNSRADYFAYLWEGNINITRAGTYIFETVSDDGSRFYFNKTYTSTATPTVNNDGLHASKSVTATVSNIAVGIYPIAISYFENSSGEQMELWYSGPGITRQRVPNSAFSAGSDNVAPSKPLNLKVVNTFSNSISLDWDDATDNTTVSGYNVYIDGVQKYTSPTSDIIADNLAPSTSYRFTVRALDPTGNLSDSSAGLSASTISASSGLRYSYYEGEYWAVPDYTKLTPKKTGTSANIDLGVRSINDNFTILWEGNINITTPGSYTFETLSDDGSKFFFKTLYTPTAVALVNNDGPHGPTSVSATVNIPQAGVFPIAIAYLELTGGEKMELYYSGPGITRQLVPNNVLSLPSADVTPPSVPTGLTLASALNNSLSLDWDDATDNIAVTKYIVFVNGVKTDSSATSNIVISQLTAGTAYTVKVKAIDQAGNESAFSTEISASTTSSSNGLRYSYYEGEYWAIPDYTKITPKKTGTSPNIDLGVRSINDNFTILWEGNINITTPGSYTFETLSDDGSKFFFKTLYTPTAVALVNNDGPHGPTSVSATVNIPQAGVFPIAIAYLELTGGEKMELYYSGPGITRQLVPNNVLSLPSADVTAPSVPTGLTLASALNNSLSLDWDDATDNIAVTKYIVFVNGVRTDSSATSNIVISQLTAGTAYNVKVKALDQAGNESAFSTEISASTTSSSNGLRYNYYEGEYWAIPDYTKLTPKKTGTSPNIDLGVRSINDNFTILWEGNINITTPGNYTFETISDDGSKFFFKTLYTPTAVALVNNDGPHGPTSVSATVNIPQAGVFPIAIAYLELTGGEKMELYYSGPGITRQLVPNNILTLPSSDATPPSAPGNLKAVYTGRNFAYLDWDASTDNVGVVKYDVYVNNVKKYSTTETTLTDSALAAGTSYSFAVKAVDVAGNESLASTISAATEATANGLKYRFYQGTWDALPNFNTLTPVKTGSSANVNLGVRTAGVNDNYAFVWEGYINIKTAGTYTFETISDDGSKLFFKNLYFPAATALVNNDYTHGSNSVSATVNIPVAGLYPISMTFFELGGGETMEIYWSGPGFTRQAIPDAAFVETAGAGQSTDIVQTLGAGNRNISGSLISADNAGTTSLEEISRGSLLTKAFPNPFRENLNIQYYNTAAGNKVSVDICDLAGRVIFNRKYDNLPAGSSTLALNSITRQLSPGMYTLRLNVNGIPNKVWKVVKAKN